MLRVTRVLALASAKVYTKNETCKMRSHIRKHSEEFSEEMADFGLFSAERFGKNSSVSCFAEIFAFEHIFGCGKGIYQLGFAFVGYVAQK